MAGSERQTSLSDGLSQYEVCTRIVQVLREYLYENRTLHNFFLISLIENRQILDICCWKAVQVKTLLKLFLFRGAQLSSI